MTITVDVAPKNQFRLICDTASLEIIREEFSIENSAKSFRKIPLMKRKFMPSRLYAITPTGLFDFGLLQNILQVIVSKQLASDIQFTAECKSTINQLRQNIEVDDKLKFQMRDYQFEAVKSCIESGHGICKYATGAGKTLIIANLVQNYIAANPSYTCLIMVPDPGLALQTFNDFKEYGVTFSCGLWTGQHELDKTANVIIANQDIVLSRFEKNDWIKYVDILICDEVHTIKKDNKINKIVSKISTKRRFGFTGTLPTSKLDYWNVIGKFGPVIIEKTSNELREAGFLANVEAKIIDIIYKNVKLNTALFLDEKGEKLSTTDYRAELDFIYNNEYRNNLISQICCNFNNNCLIVVNHLQHGRSLHTLLKDKISNKRVEFIEGETDLDTRESIKKEMESRNDMIVIAMSSIFSTGINIKNIHMIMIAAGGKSFIRIVQTIGRGLRLHERKDKLIIIDISDDLEYSDKHTQVRTAIYDSEKIKYTVTQFKEK